MKPGHPKGHWPRWVLIVPLILVGMVLFRSFLPQAKAVLPSCLFYESTGIFCPGCGGTRAAEALVKFELGEALRQNAWAVSAVLIGLPATLLAAMRIRFPQVSWLNHFRWRPWMVWFLVGSIGLFGVLRNFPAFDWLAPLSR
ncbi:DUF2752 domain-containing protein [Akkermansiaceae bacterium]|nr:DUF2752 domain-containing protein [Akkermansiaceae bacterium]MDB4544504.1 DUF2752 domain-containing protein [Akkermansiaceae bacterium]